MPLDTAFHKAAYKMDYQTVEEFIRQHPNQINIPGAQNRTALHRAIGAGSNNQLIIDLLINKNADVNAKDASGLTPLHWCALFGYVSYGKGLLNSNATIDCVTNTGETPLHLCSERGHVSFALLLLEHKADVTITDKNNITAYDVAKRAQNSEIMDIVRPPGQGHCCVSI